MLLAESKYRKKQRSIIYAKSTCEKLNMGTTATVYCLLPLWDALDNIELLMPFKRSTHIQTSELPDTKFSIRLGYKRFSKHRPGNIAFAFSVNGRSRMLLSGYAMKTQIWDAMGKELSTRKDGNWRYKESILTGYWVWWKVTRFFLWTMNEL